MRPAQPRLREARSVRDGAHVCAATYVSNDLTTLVWRLVTSPWYLENNR